MNKFEVGMTYKSSSQLCDNSTFVVVERQDNKVTMKEFFVDSNGEEKIEFVKFDILMECGIEKILIWECRGHEAYLYANEGK